MLHAHISARLISECKAPAVHMPGLVSGWEPAEVSGAARGRQAAVAAFTAGPGIPQAAVPACCAACLETCIGALSPKGVPLQRPLALAGRLQLV